MVNNYYISSFLWSTINKITAAIIGFLSVPLLLNYFGVASFGILSIAIAVNSYIQLLDMGMNTGAIKYYSQWRSSKNYDMIEKVAGTSISLYAAIGLINSLLLVLLAFFGDHIFTVTEDQFGELRTAMLILALFSVFNWISTAFSQLLISDQRIAYVQRLLIITNLLKLGVIYITISVELSFGQYFLLLTAATSWLVIPLALEAKQRELLQSVAPKFYWKEFKVVLTYSLAIFAYGIFSMTATQSRPLILGIFSAEAAKVVAEYKIIEVFPLFIISLGGTLSTIFLPISSKIIGSENQNGKEDLAYNGTIYSSILCCLLCIPVILNAHSLLGLFVGFEYSYLSGWLSLWCWIVLIFLHSTPCNSLILATGKTKALVITTAFSCILSIAINAFLSQYYGVGSAVIGFLVYIGIQMSFQYLYLYKKILRLDSFKVFTSFVYPVILAILSYLIIVFFYPVGSINHSTINLISDSFLKSILWATLFLLSLHLLKVVNMGDILAKLKKQS